jgi:hypothetical protein
LIPPFSVSGVLPPFIGSDPIKRGAQSPYVAKMTEVVSRFGTTPERGTLIRGLAEYRSALRRIGVTVGHQWIAGSFVEECERLRGTNPGDIDVVTLATRPSGLSQTSWLNLVATNRHVFSPSESKQRYHCDAYFVDLDKPGRLIWTDTLYFGALFSHQRATSLWKGMLLVDLNSDDATAMSNL